MVALLTIVASVGQFYTRTYIAIAEAAVSTGLSALLMAHIKWLLDVRLKYSISYSTFDGALLMEQKSMPQLIFDPSGNHINVQNQF